MLMIAVVAALPVVASPALAQQQPSRWDQHQSVMVPVAAGALAGALILPVLYPVAAAAVGTSAMAVGTVVTEVVTAAGTTAEAVGTAIHTSLSAGSTASQAVLGGVVGAVGGWWYANSAK
jgi:hypothetical protein